MKRIRQVQHSASKSERYDGEDETDRIVALGGVTGGRHAAYAFSTKNTPGYTCSAATSFRSNSGVGPQWGLRTKVESRACTEFARAFARPMAVESEGSRAPPQFSQ